MEPTHTGICSICSNDSHHLWGMKSPESSDEREQFFACKECMKNQFGLDVGEICWHCHSWAPLTKGTIYIDRAEDRYMYSQVMDELIAEQSFPNEDVDGMYCNECLGFQTENSEKPHSYLNNFENRSLFGLIAEILLDDTLKTFGYLTKPVGYEHTHREWIADIKDISPSTNVNSLRRMPDLEVFDKDSELYERVEVKATNMAFTEWTFPITKFEQIKAYHPTTLLSVFHVKSGQFRLQRVNNLEGMDTVNGDCYSFNLGIEFLPINEFFEKVDLKALLERNRVLSKMFQSYGAGLSIF